LVNKKIESDKGVIVKTEDILKNSIVNINKYSDQEIIISTKSNEKALLVLSDYYYPGWSVIVDDAVAEIIQTSLNMRAVALAAGCHIVKFIYKEF